MITPTNFTTAQQARVLSSAITNEKTQLELQKAQSNITRACREGKTSVTLYNFAFSATSKKFLSELGYSIHVYAGDQRDGSSTTISW